MGRKKGKLKRVVEPVLDATPERLAKGDPFDWVNPGKIDSSEQPLGNNRRFVRVVHLDRWHRAELITQRQWWAGDAYRKLHESVERMPRVVASYGERTTGGETDYGMARTAAQARRRDAFRKARASLSPEIVGMLDRFILRNALPKYRGRAHDRAKTIIRAGLDALAMHFECRRSDEALDQRNNFLYELPR